MAGFRSGKGGRTRPEDTTAPRPARGGSFTNGRSPWPVGRLPPTGAPAALPFPRQPLSSGLHSECEWSLIGFQSPRGTGRKGAFARLLSLLSPRPVATWPMREPKVTVKIPRPLYRKVQQVVEDSGFNSPTDFIVYVLRDLMGEAEEHPREFTHEELQDVKRKLKNLGYL